MPCFRKVIGSIGLALFCALGSPGCLLTPDARQADKATSEIADELGGFSSSLFAFTTTVADDGKNEGGEWQEATATLKFKDLEYTTNPKAWTCTLRVGMPIRSSTNGVILAEWAADISAAKATDASSIVMHSAPSWPITELFCRAFADEMERGLKIWEPGGKVKKT